MLSLGNQVFLVQTPSDLPTKFGREVFLDVETQNNTEDVLPKEHSGFTPFLGDRICGFSFTFDDDPKTYYVPIRHRSLLGGDAPENLPLKPVQQWLNRMFASVEDWVNHNISFDGKFLYFDDVDVECRMICTLTLAKVHDSDRMNYNLKTEGARPGLCETWCNEPMITNDRIKEFLRSLESRDYSRVPVDMMAVYACSDVRGNRKLYRYLCERRATGLERIWDNEIKLTPVLMDMELEGLRVDPRRCKLESIRCLRKLIDVTTRIMEITGTEWTNSPQCIHEILVGQFGLPVLATKKERERGMWIDTGRPSFDRDAMSLYANHPQVLASTELIELVQSILEYRKEATHKSFFLDAFLLLHDENDHIHPNYNQVVRTGRMSCRAPNIQQQNKRSKRLILPDEGYGFISADYSQIEYRGIAHYTKDEAIIRAYNEDPDTDFHSWVAGIISEAFGAPISRSQAKTINFGMAYGAGKPTVTLNLRRSAELTEKIAADVQEMVESGEINESSMNATFQKLCYDHAAEIYGLYHETIPRIKQLSRAARDNCKRRGYVFNSFGRRRHLPPEFSHKAFNSVIQGWAMDVMKERMVALSPRYNAQSRSYGLTLKANVHDEVLSQVPLDLLEDPKVLAFIKETLETTDIKFRVPIRTDIGTSAKNWGEAV